jgi:hypothetical protein
MSYFITDRSGQIHEFDNWMDAIKFAVHQARLSPQTPMYISSGLNQYQILSNGEVDRLETYCACDTCRFCDSPDGSATCPYYWEQPVWEHYDTYEG